MKVRKDAKLTDTLSLKRLVYMYIDLFSRTRSRSSFDESIATKNDKLYFCKSKHIVKLYSSITESSVTRYICEESDERINCVCEFDSSVYNKQHRKPKGT